MSLIANGAGEQPTGFYNGVATQSLRFDDGSSAYLTRTPSSASNRRTFTFSAWIKRGVLDANNVGGQNDTPIFSAASANNQPHDSIRTLSQLTAGAHILQLYTNPSGSTDYSEETNASIRDTTAWYHIVVAVDTTQSTAGNRVKFYINGTLQTAVGQYYAQVPQNHDFHFNDDVAQEIGRNAGNTARYFDGYMAEVNFVDGTQYAASNFGETKNGIWIAKTPNVTYGTEGFRLQFDQVGVGTASTSTIGADTSGNNNHFTSSGIVASDCAMPDSPENNFTTLNPLMNYGESSRVVSEGNLKFSDSTNNSTYARIGANLPLQGKWYWEVLISGTLSSYLFANGTFDIEDNNNIVSGTTNSTELTGCHCIRENGKYYDNNSLTASYASFSSGDILQVYFDADIGSLFMGRNGTAFNSGSAVATSLPAQEIHCSVAQNDAFSTYNFGQDSSFAGAKTAQGNTDGNGIGDFYYEPPSGFLALCSANLPEPTIGPNSGDDKQANDHFNTVLRSGNGSSGGSVTVGFKPDWVWEKTRSHNSYHTVWDSSRGLPKHLYTNETAGQGDSTWLTAFASNGLTYGTNDYSDSVNLVVWNWKANGGTTSSVDAGSGSNISNGTTNHATVQANTTAGFSIVITTNTVRSTAKMKIPHGLGATPHFILAKNYSSDNIWSIYHQVIPSNSVMLGSSYGDDAKNSNSNFSSVGSTTFLSQSNSISNNNNEDHIFYCFTEIEGYSRFGGYTANGNANGPFIFTGFQPAWIMIKRTDAVGDWNMYDNKRSVGGASPNDLEIYANLNNAEYDSGRDVDFLANGFKLRTVNYVNVSGGSYIYMAFAKIPFKYATGIL